MKLARVALPVLLAAAAALSAAPSASAQIFTPTYLGPRSSSDLGVYLSDGPGDFAVEGIVRRNFGGTDLGFRVGVADADDAVLLLGGELRNPIALAAPVDLAFTLGGQALLGDAEAFGLQGGLAIGATFAGPGLSVSPYIHPRLAMVDRGDDDFELDGLADIGIDLGFSPNLTLRFGIELQSPGGADFGVGLAWR